MVPPRKPFMVVFLASFVVSGAILWIIPYEEASLLEPSFYWKWLVAIGVIAAVASQRTSLTFSDCVTAAGFGPAAADLARIVVESSLNPTRHDMWPFEIIVSLCIGGIAALAGAGAVFTTKKFRKRTQQDT